MTTISTQYSLWFLPICLIGGFLYAWFLYRKDQKLKKVSRIIKILMFALRFLSISIIAFLLLSPIMLNFGKTIEKPIIIYAQDNSESVLLAKDTINKFANELKKYFKNNPDYNFKIFAFGENVEEKDTFNFQDKETDIAGVLSNVKNRFYNQNIGAVILSSDGIHNKGNNPDYEVKDVNFPVYTVALGDTNIRKDLILSEVKYNKTAFLNSEFPLKIKVKADKLPGRNTILKIYDGGKLIYNQNIKINSDNFYKTYDVKIKAGKVGFHKIKIELSALENEVSNKNNVKQIIIEVSDKKQKILILSDAPHPDIAALIEALKLNQNLKTDYYPISKFNKSVKLYNLVILNQLPSINNSATSVLSKIINLDIPVIFMLGGNSSSEKFDNLNIGLTTGAYSNKPDEVTGKLNSNFNLFDINSEIEKITLNSPPLISAFGDYKLSGMSEILFYRQIKNINTNLPLIVFNTGTGNKKSAIITGEGIWRWRIYDYKMNQNHYLFNELINRMVQFLISKETKSRFNIITDKIFPENQNVIIKAETFDEKFQLTETDKISFQLEDSAKNIDYYTFKKYGKIYRINLNKLPVGDYKWKSKALINGKEFERNGIFSVVPIYAEYSFTKANHELLYKLSKHTNGKLFYPHEVSKLIQEIKKNDNIKPISYSEKKTEALINFKLIFFIILTLLTTEWFLRKYFGNL